MQMSLMHPRLMAALILMEPIVGTSIDACQGLNLTRLSTFRRDLWNSHAEAAEASKKMYKTWDPSVLERWIQHGFRKLPTTIYPDIATDAKDIPVTLATTKHQEVMSYLRPNFQGFIEPSAGGVVDHSTHADIIGPAESICDFYRAEPLLLHNNLPHLRPSVLYIFGGKSPVSTPSLRKEKLDRTGTGIGGSGGVISGHVREVLVPKSGHLVAMEAVEECAQAAAPWIEFEAEHWKKEEQRLLVGWAERDQKAKTTVSPEWIQHLKNKL
jgi:pimeloyl-ACP methyl ester carboxylesterase